MIINLAAFADVAVQAAVRGELIQLLSAGSLPMHPSLLYMGSINGKGTDVLRQAFIGWGGYDRMTPVGEGVAIADTALTLDTVDLQPVRHGLARTATDIAKIVDPLGVVNVQMLAQDALGSYMETLAAKIAPLSGGFSNTVGTGSTDLSLATFVAGQNDCDARGVRGPLLSMLHPVAFGHLRAELVGATNGWIAGTQELIQRLGSNYKGNFLGTDIVTHSDCPSTSNYKGGIFGRGAIVWGDGATDLSDVDGAVSIAGLVSLEKDRDGRRGKTSYISAAWLAATEGRDDFGTTFISQL